MKSRKTLPLQQDYRYSLFSRPAESKAVPDERNINERNPKTDRSRARDKAGRRRNETASFEVLREHVRNISSGDFDILGKIRYESAAILPRYTRAHVSTVTRGSNTVTLSRTFFLRSSTRVRPSIFDRWCIHQRWFRGGTREIRRE